MQVVAIGNQPTMNLSAYSLETLKQLTEMYSMGRGKRQTMNGESVYIAANITESELAIGFTLGDGNEDDGYVNHPLEPDMEYTVGLWSQVNGTDTPLILDLKTQQPISK